MPLKVVVIGGVAAGPKTAAKIMRLNPQAEVTLLEKGKFISFAGCGLPYYVSGAVKTQKELMSTPVGVLRDAAFFQSAGAGNGSGRNSISGRSAPGRGVGITPPCWHHARVRSAAASEPDPGSVRQ